MIMKQSRTPQLKQDRTPITCRPARWSLHCPKTFPAGGVFVNETSQRHPTEPSRSAI
jgi:hypothetical protein